MSRNLKVRIKRQILAATIPAGGAITWSSKPPEL